MAKVRIDEGWLLMALDSGDGMESWYLDRQTGEVIRLSDFDELEEEEEIRESIHDFAASQKDERVRGVLMDALDRRRPFRAFKDALLGLGEVREQWFKYHEDRLREHARDWLRVEGVDAELVPYIAPPGETEGP